MAHPDKVMNWKGAIKYALSVNALSVNASGRQDRGLSDPWGMNEERRESFFIRGGLKRFFLNIVDRVREMAPQEINKSVTGIHNPNRGAKVGLQSTRRGKLELLLAISGPDVMKAECAAWVDGLTGISSDRHTICVPSHRNQHSKLGGGEVLRFVDVDLTPTEVVSI